MAKKNGMEEHPNLEDNKQRLEPPDPEPPDPKEPDPEPLMERLQR